MLEILGTLVGLAYLWLEYRASIWLWAAGVVMPAIYIAVYYEAGLYADCGINVYFLLAAVYGWLAWKRSAQSSPSATENPAQGMQSLFGKAARGGLRQVLMLVAFSLLFWTLISGILVRFTDSTVPLTDAFTTALSITAMWMLAKKYIEQWLVWIVVDVVSAGLYLYKDLHFTAALYLLYAVIAVLGYIKWKRMYENHRPL